MDLTRVKIAHQHTEIIVCCDECGEEIQVCDYCNGPIKVNHLLCAEEWHFCCTNCAKDFDDE